jgi:hypothetical protein
MKTVLNSCPVFYGRTDHWQELWSYRKVLRENVKRAFSLERFLQQKSSLERLYSTKATIYRRWLSGLIVPSKLEKTQVLTRNTYDVLYTKNKKIFFNTSFFTD